MPKRFSLVLSLVIGVLVFAVPPALAETGKISSHSEDIGTKPNGVPRSPQKPFYDIEPSPVHQWIALQAYLKLSSSDLKTELANYLPTDANSFYYQGDYQGDPFVSPAGWWNNEDAPYQQSTALIEGVWEEDEGDFIQVPGFGLKPLRSFRHFWNPDGDYDAGIYVWQLALQLQSALEMAQANFYQAVAHYNITDKTNAYYWLGRTAHLLMDLTVPAHVQLDEHLTDGDNYESFTKSWEFHYKHISSSSPLTTIPSVPFMQYPRYTPSQFNDDLTNLLYELANKADEFDSDDENGDSYTYGYGKFNRASNTIDAYKVFKKAYKLAGGSEVRLLDTLSDYIIVNCAWSHDASIIYSESFYNEIWPDPFNLYGVRVYYADNSYDNFSNPDLDGVPWAV
jgi:hypothetical protein